MTSRSRFYVDTPRDPTQRHSMFVTQSELVQRQDLSSNSSSATLPSAAGSVDRLTGLDEKKSSRFFTLKPKTSFSLRPFFRSTSSVASQSPGKRRKAILERRDSGVQTEETRPEFGDVGVQTLNASTVDVPVQTCFETWDESNSYGQKRLTYATSRTSPFWNRPSVTTSALSNSLLSQNVAKDPLASPRLIKYAAPGNSEKAALHHQSASHPVNVNSCQLVSSPSSSITSSSQTAPVKYLPAKDTSSGVALFAVNQQKQLVKDSQNEQVTQIHSPASGLGNLNENLKKDSDSAGEISPQKGCVTLDNRSPEVSGNLKYSVIYNTERPLSALKIDRTDSPSRRLKTVHFDLADPEISQDLSDSSSKPRNVDKDFEALLKDLNILTDDDDDNDDSPLSLNPIPPDKIVLSNDISSSLKSAIDALKEDILAPIPENLNECSGNETDSELRIDNSIKISEKNIKAKPPSPVILNESLVNSILERENPNVVEENKNSSLPPTSPAIFTSANSASNPETDSLEGNVYDNVIKEENFVKAVPLPTLPSFFETPSHLQTAQIAEFTESVNTNNSELPPDIATESTMALETVFDRSRLSRSSSRSSIRSGSKNGIDSCRESLSRFDSCENLDQLEEEIIRSLYSPNDDKIEEKLFQNIEIPPSETFQNSGTTATHMRRVILDQLLSGKTVENIVPNCPVYQRTQSVPETSRKIKSPIKYKAVLTKLNIDDNGHCSLNFQGNRLGSPSNGVRSPVVNSDVVNEVNLPSINRTSVSKIDSPKKTSVFLFPEYSVPNSDNLKTPKLEISTNGNQNNKDSSILEVRRSSWTAQSTRDSPSDSGAGRGTSPCKEKDSENKTGLCDFTNCLRPSEIQNSPFLAKINTRSMSPCNFSPLPRQTPSPVNNTSRVKVNNVTKPPEAVGECDFASCLKPSQVQNSLFTAELSELTANKSTNSLRAGSPFSTRTHSPLPVRCNSTDIPRKPPNEEKINNNENDPSETVKHRSEITITLKTANENIKNNTENKSETPPNTETKPISEMSHSDDSKLPDSDDTEKSNFAIPPPPPPPPPSADAAKTFIYVKDPNTCSMDTMLQNQKHNLQAVDVSEIPKTSVVIELEQRLQDNKSPIRRNSNDKNDDSSISSSEDYENINDFGIPETKLNGSSKYIANGSQNGNFHFLAEPTEYNSSILNSKTDADFFETARLKLSPSTDITDEPPPHGSVLLDKKITVDGDKIHTDKYFAIPVKEVLKEKTSTTKFIPAPPKYEGIGPTEDGIPIGLRNSVKKENMHNWYKTMFKSLHKADSSNDPQEYIIGYTSEPETSKKDMMIRKKTSTLDNRGKYDVNSNFNKQNYPPSVKSSIEVYNVRPRLIEDYEPGYSSVTDDHVITSKRYLPSKNTVKPSYVFKNGYESDSNITKKRDQPEPMSFEQQKMWYREIQKGADIPQFGLGKQAPETPQDPAIGPVPPPPLNYSTQPSYQQAVRPPSLPADYSNQNGNGYCQQMNGAYEMQMRHAIHSEMHQKLSSPTPTNQLSPPNRTTTKSPSRSPDMKVPARALFDFKTESPKEIPLKKGDSVLILRQLDKNWYEGEHKGVVGIFPISYVEIIPPEHVPAPITIRTEGIGKALYDFVAQTSIELTVRKGDTITLLKRVDGNWFEGVLNKKKGIVPISYIQVLQEPIDRNLSSPSQKSLSPSLSISENQERLSKSSCISPSSYSSSVSPLPQTTSDKRITLNKKGSSLVEPIMYRALYSYSPQNSDELELQEGDNVYVVEMCDDGWYVGTSVRNGVFGIFPGNYVEKNS